MASEKIKHLTDRQAVRMNVGQYLGGNEVDETGKNSESVCNGLREVIDNSNDEAILKRSNTTWVSKEKCSEPLGLKKYENKSISFVKEWYKYTVADLGGGIPIEKTKFGGKEITMTELAMSSLNSGSKFEKIEDTGGQHGVGASAMVFTSAYFAIYSNLSCHDWTKTTKEVQSMIKKSKVTKKNSNDFYYKLTFNLGEKIKEEIININKDSDLSKFCKAKARPSTISVFIPDPTIHNTTDALLPNSFVYTKYLYPKFNAYINWKKDNSKVPKYSFSDVVEIKLDKNVKDYDTIQNKTIKYSFSFDIADDIKKTEKNFSINTISCQSGSHIKIFENNFAHAFCKYFKDDQLLPYVARGLNIFCVVQCKRVLYSSQTKEKCSSIEGFSSTKIYDELQKSFTKIIKNNQKVFEQHYERILEYYNAQLNVGKLKELQGMLGEMVSGKNKSFSKYMPKKLNDCPSKDRKNCELYLTEGSSAEGSFSKAKTGYDNIAVMGLRGNIQNTVGYDINDILNNSKSNEIPDLVYLCGGVDGVHLTLDKLPFGKYIIATDADSDGGHIASLILAHILQHSSFMFGTEENNYEDSVVYRIDAPLYLFANVDGTSNNQYFYAGEEKKMNEWKSKHKYKTEKRFKGLGEISKREIQELYLNPDTRRLIKIKPQDIDETLELMSTNDDGVQARKRLLVNNHIWTDGTVDLTDLIEDLGGTVAKRKGKKRSKK